MLSVPMTRTPARVVILNRFRCVGSMDKDSTKPTFRWRANPYTD